MTRFWLATFDMPRSTDAAAIGPIISAGADHLAIEILRDGDAWAVLFSSVTDPVDPASMTCLIGFTNVAKACNVWLGRGFPLVDAAVTVDQNDTLTIVSPFFCDTSLMQYESPLLTLSGIRFSGNAGADVKTASREVKTRAASTAPGGTGAKRMSENDWPAQSSGGLDTTYNQQLQTPDEARPDQFVRRTPASWRPVRSNVHQHSPEYVSAIQLSFDLTPSRCPSLVPLSKDLTARAAWSGDLELPTGAASRGERMVAQPFTQTFGSPTFRFEDVEILGFRVDLSKLGRPFQQELEDLIAPLNFHLSPGADSIPDFRYRAATSTVVIELLRYGRMKARRPSPPLRLDDSQSQHELVVRILVGRVDDDSAQAHAPAVYVPAVFVDNPWSKVLGRDAIGYDKRMAEFYVTRGDDLVRLLPDGRVVSAAAIGSVERQPEPLGAIRHVKLAQTIGAGSGKPLLDLSFSPEDPTDPAELQPFDLDLVFGMSSLAGARWRQSDFGDAEFRRSFASAAVADSVRSFRSIQVAPVANADLGQTWVTSRFSLDDTVRAALPLGRATLTLHPVAGNGKTASETPKAWNTLCALLGGGGEARVTLPAGSWYRLFCSMNLTIDDGLDWTTLGG